MPVLEEAKTMVTSPTITYHHGDGHFQNIQNGGQGRGEDRLRRKSIDQNSRLFLFSRAFYLSFRYYELGSALRTGSNHSCAIVLRLLRAL